MLIYSGRVSRLAICILFIRFASFVHQRHQCAYLALVGGAGVHHAGDLAAAQNDVSVAQASSSTSRSSPTYTTATPRIFCLEVYKTNICNYYNFLRKEVNKYGARKITDIISSSSDALTTVDGIITSIYKSHMRKYERADSYLETVILEKGFASDKDVETAARLYGIPMLHKNTET